MKSKFLQTQAILYLTQLISNSNHSNIDPNDLTQMIQILVSFFKDEIEPSYEMLKMAFILNQPIMYYKEYGYFLIQAVLSKGIPYELRINEPDDPLYPYEDIIRKCLRNTEIAKSTLDTQYDSEKQISSSKIKETDNQRLFALTKKYISSPLNSTALSSNSYIEEYGFNLKTFIVVDEKRGQKLSVSIDYFFQGMNEYLRSKREFRSILDKITEEYGTDPIQFFLDRVDPEDIKFFKFPLSIDYMHEYLAKVLQSRIDGTVNLRFFPKAQNSESSSSNHATLCSSSKFEETIPEVAEEIKQAASLVTEKEESVMEEIRKLIDIELFSEDMRAYLESFKSKKDFKIVFERISEEYGLDPLDYFRDFIDAIDFEPMSIPVRVHDIYYNLENVLNIKTQEDGSRVNEHTKRRFQLLEIVAARNTVSFYEYMPRVMKKIKKFVLDYYNNFFNEEDNLILLSDFKSFKNLTSAEVENLTKTNIAKKSRKSLKCEIAKLNSQDMNNFLETLFAKVRGTSEPVFHLELFKKMIPLETWIESANKKNACHLKR